MSETSSETLKPPPSAEGTKPAEEKKKEHPVKEFARKHALKAVLIAGAAAGVVGGGPRPTEAPAPEGPTPSPPGLVPEAPKPPTVEGEVKASAPLSEFFLQPKEIRKERLVDRIGQEVTFRVDTPDFGLDSFGRQVKAAGGEEYVSFSILAPFPGKTGEKAWDNNQLQIDYFPLLMLPEDAAAYKQNKLGMSFNYPYTPAVSIPVGSVIKAEVIDLEVVDSSVNPNLGNPHLLFKEIVFPGSEPAAPTETRIEE